jgi:hypothetical protein
VVRASSGVSASGSGAAGSAAGSGAPRDDQRQRARVYPQSHVAFIDCELGAHVSGAAWTVTGGGGSALRFWEYGSKSPSGQAVDTAQRHGASRQLSADEAAMMRDPAVVLAGWKP